jgi:hypothetical protein
LEPQIDNILEGFQDAKNMPQCVERSIKIILYLLNSQIKSESNEAAAISMKDIEKEV